MVERVLVEILKDTEKRNGVREDQCITLRLLSWALERADEDYLEFSKDVPECKLPECFASYLERYSDVPLESLARASGNLIECGISFLSLRDDAEDAYVLTLLLGFGLRLSNDDKRKVSVEARKNYRRLVCAYIQA